MYIQRESNIRNTPQHNAVHYKTTLNFDLNSENVIWIYNFLAMLPKAEHSEPYKRWMYVMAELLYWTGVADKWALSVFVLLGSPGI